jgi:hypothetical protein
VFEEIRKEAESLRQRDEEDFGTGMCSGWRRGNVMVLHCIYKYIYIFKKLYLS